MVSMEFLAKYPFTAGAKAFVQGEGFTWERLLTGADCESIRRHGVRRVAAAINNAIVDERERRGEDDHRPLYEKWPVNPELTELLSYPVARMIVSVLHDDRLSNKLVVWESKRLGRFLADESSSTIFELGRELGIPASRKDASHVQLYFGDYVVYSSQFKDDSWKLSNRVMEGGRVILDYATYSRLLEEAYKFRELSRLRDKQRDIPDGEVPLDIAPLINALEPVLARFREETRVESTPQGDWAYPPCMKALLDGLFRGQNLAHPARFGITAFLANIGMDSEGILKLYTSAPDFDPEKARYQVEHICERGYTAPTCKTMQMNHLCHGKDGLCEYLDHPLVYYRRKVRRSLKQGSDE